MRRNHSDEYAGDAYSLAMEYRDAAEEDLYCVEKMRSDRFGAAHNTCMLAARASEKFIKSKLLFMGRDVSWIHDQTSLINMFGDFEGKDRAIEIASLLSTYAINANYPSITRTHIGSEEAADAYDMLMEMIAIIRPYDTDMPCLPLKNLRRRRSIFLRKTR